VVVVPKDEIRG